MSRTKTQLARVRGRERSRDGRSLFFEQTPRQGEALSRCEYLGWSVIKHITSHKDGECIVTIPVWLAEKCGFDYEEI